MTECILICHVLLTNAAVDYTVMMNDLIILLLFTVTHHTSLRDLANGSGLHSDVLLQWLYSSTQIYQILAP